MTRMPACTVSSRADSGRLAMCDPSLTRTRCDTSSASDRSATNWRGMPMRRVTMCEMSTASLAMRSMAETTWSTEDMPSASRALRAASTHTARMS